MATINDNIFRNSSIAAATITSITHDASTLPPGITVTLDDPTSGDVTVETDSMFDQFDVKLSCVFSVDYFRDDPNCSCSDSQVVCITIADDNPPQELTCTEFNTECGSQLAFPISCGVDEPDIQFLFPSSEWIQSDELTGLQFSVANGFTDPVHTGTHLHTDPAGGGPPTLPVDMMEVGGYFGDETIRGHVEFDLAGTSTPANGKLRFSVADLSAFDPSGLNGSPFGQLKYVGDVEVYAYVGDNSVAVTDFNQPGTLIGSITIPVSVAAGTEYEVDVPSSFLNTSSVGFQFRIAGENLANPIDEAITFENSSLSMTEVGCAPKADVVAALNSIAQVGVPAVYRSGCIIEFSQTTTAGYTAKLSIDLNGSVMTASVEVTDDQGNVVLDFPLVYNSGSCVAPFEPDQVQYGFAFQNVSPPTIGATCVDTNEPGPTFILNPGGAPGC